MEKSDHEVGFNDVDPLHLSDELFREIAQHFFELEVIRKRIMNEGDGKLILQLRDFFFQCPYDVVKNIRFPFLPVLVSIQTVDDIAFDII